MQLGHTDGEYYFRGLTCQEKWKLKDPEYAWKGCFLRMSENKITVRSNKGLIVRVGIAIRYG